MTDEELMSVAIEQARIGRAEGGIPIGAALAVDGDVVAVAAERAASRKAATFAARRAPVPTVRLEAT